MVFNSFRKSSKIFIETNIFIFTIRTSKRSIDHLPFIDSFKVGLDFIAQQVEHYTFNVGVVGSIPTGITRKDKRLYEDFQRSEIGSFLYRFRLLQ